MAKIRRNILLNLLLEKGAIKGITSDSGMDFNYCYPLIAQNSSSEMKK